MTLVAINPTLVATIDLWLTNGTHLVILKCGNEATAFIPDYEKEHLAVIASKPPTRGPAPRRKWPVRR